MQGNAFLKNPSSPSAHHFFPPFASPSNQAFLTCLGHTWNLQIPGSVARCHARLRLAIAESRLPPLGGSPLPALRAVPSPAPSPEPEESPTPSSVREPAGRQPEEEEEGGPQEWQRLLAEYEVAEEARQSRMHECVVRNQLDVSPQCNAPLRNRFERSLQSGDISCGG